MYFLGIDLGTSSVKVLAIDEKANIIGDTSREYDVYYPKENWAEQNPEDWWQGTKEAIIELIDKYHIPKDQIKGISFSGQMHGLVALDQEDNVLLPAILWCDQRTEKECEEITKHFGQQQLSQYTGNKALTGFTAPKILWVKKHKPEVFKKVKHILLPKDYIRFKLTGEYATGVSDASGMLLLDVKNKCWSEPMIDFLELEKEVLPDLYESYDITGRLTKEAKEALGLEGEIIVTGGAGDNAAGAIGTGTIKEGMVSVSLGTSGVIFAAQDQYAVDEQNRLHAFCHANGHFHSMGVMLSAASSLKWWVEQVNKGTSFDILLQEAANVKKESTVFFLPYLLGERTPYSDPDAKGAFIGLSMNTGRGEMTKAVLEGVAFGLRDSLEILKDLKIPLDIIRVIGGGAKSVLWKQILANIFNCTLEEINTNQGGALGAAILAAVGAKAYETIDDACNEFIHVVNQVQPQKDKVISYNKLYPLYKQLYAELQNWFKQSAKVREELS